MIKDKEKNFVSAIVYVHNNANVIGNFIDRLYQLLDENFLKFEIICVNDNSKDNSVAILKEKVSFFSKGVISIVNMSFVQGLELSMNAGVDLSIGDFVLEFDNVGIDVPVEMFMDAYKRSLQGFDIVSIAPKSGTKIESKIFYDIFNSFSHKNYSLHTEYYHIISRRAINRCQSLGKTIPYRKAVYADCGLKIDSILYENKTSFTSRNGDNNFDTALDALILFTRVATKINFYIIVMFILSCIVVLGYVVWIYATGNPVLGWTTTMLFTSFAFMSLFIVLGIILKYLSVIIELIFKNRTYVTESIEKLTK